MGARKAAGQLAEAVALHHDMLTGFRRAIQRDVERERKAHYTRLEQQAARRPRSG